MRSLIKYLEKVETALISMSGLTVLLAMVLVVFDAVVRKLAFSVPGLYETSELFMVGIVFLGAGYVMARGRHIRVDLFVDRLNPRWRRYVEIVVLAMVVIAFTLVLWRSGDAAYTAWHIGEARSGLIKYPVWPAKVLVPIGISVLWLRLVVDLVRAVVRGEEERCAPMG